MRASEMVCIPRGGHITAKNRCTYHFGEVKLNSPNCFPSNHEVFALNVNLQAHVTVVVNLHTVEDSTRVYHSAPPPPPPQPTYRPLLSDELRVTDDKSDRNAAQARTTVSADQQICPSMSF